MNTHEAAPKSGKDPKAIAKGILLACVVGYFVAFVLKNRHDVEVSFVFFTAQTSMVFVLVLSALLGMVFGFIFGALRRRRSK